MKIISAFPGTGKTYFSSTTNLSVLDFGSGGYSRIPNAGEKVDWPLNPEFPGNYLRAMKKVMGDHDIIFVSCQGSFTEAMVAESLDFYLVYPDRNLKEEYIQRYRQRGSPESWIANIERNWDEWLKENETQEGCTHIRLSSGQYISDVILLD